MIPIALTIAGSDPSGGAGLQADLKTFHQFGVYGTSAVTLLTVQNTLAVTAIQPVTPAFLLAQIEAILEDIPPAAAKSGALGPLAQTLATRAAHFTFPLVVDPVMVSKHGSSLTGDPSPLLPHAALLTPNLPEAAYLANMEIVTVADMREAARRLLLLGPRAVLIKGGHLDSPESTDVLLIGTTYTELNTPRIPTPHTHGTGCTYSAAITALLACGLELLPAVERAKAFVTRAIRTNPGLGHGKGPLNHWA